MIELFLIITPFLIADVVNPVLFAFMVYAAGTDRPIINSSAILLGHTLAYFSAGIVIALGLEHITEYLANPGAVDYALSLIVGILLLWASFNLGNATDKKQTENRDLLTPVKAFGMGAIINFIGIPFALPYFAVIDQILKVDLSANEVILMLSGYNFLYALPFLIVPVLVAFFGEKSADLLQRINVILDRVSGFIMPILLGAIGLALIIDAILYYFTDKGMF